MENKNDLNQNQSVEVERQGSTMTSEQLAENGFALPKRNLMLIAVGFVIIIAGLVCMIGSPTGWLSTLLFSVSAVSSGPSCNSIWLLLRYFAVLWMPKNKERWIMDTLQTIIISIVEGLTEFLPVSSTGHMIITQNLLGVQSTPL